MGYDICMSKYTHNLANLRFVFPQSVMEGYEDVSADLPSDPYPSVEWTYPTTPHGMLMAAQMAAHMFCTLYRSTHSCGDIQVYILGKGWTVLGLQNTYCRAYLHSGGDHDTEMNTLTKLILTDLESML